MKPVSPVLPNAPDLEHVLGANQHEYIPLPVFRTDKSTLSRWRLSDEERTYIANGGDLFICQLNFGAAIQPILPIADLPDDALRIMLECEAEVS